MKQPLLLSMMVSLSVITCGDRIGASAAGTSLPFGTQKPGVFATYEARSEEELPGSNVARFTLWFGDTEKVEQGPVQWVGMRAEKAGGGSFSVWVESDQFPPSMDRKHSARRYLLEEEGGRPIEFVEEVTGGAVLPRVGSLPHLFPVPIEGTETREGLPLRVRMLGFEFTLAESGKDDSRTPPSDPFRIALLSDLFLGVASNQRQVDDTRRWDESEYDYVRFTQADYERMIEAGLNCYRVDGEQAGWVRDRNVYYWGIGGAEVPYPECLYRSNYLGPALYLDEPGVVTRDHVVRPRFEKEPSLRADITPQYVLEAFEEHFRDKNRGGSATALLSSLDAREDVDVGEMDFLQANLYTWETFVSTAAFQLTDLPEGPPAAFVFETPGRFGTRRVLPEMNMAYGCQIPTENPYNLSNIIFGFARGGARIAGKEWGTSIYGAVDRADTFLWFTRAYDLGATHFFFWDSYQIAAVPFSEALAVSRHLRNHAESHPRRDLAKLRNRAEVAILLPPGYNLGHVHMGRGNLWGLGELNLDRKNAAGIPYRTVMRNFATEIERCLRLGIEFDLLWDLEGLDTSSYTAVYHVLEDGTVLLESAQGEAVLQTPRNPPRPEGESPSLEVKLSSSGSQAPLEVQAEARVTEGASPVYYTIGTDKQGVYRNAAVLWELYGPEEYDYRFLNQGNETLRSAPTESGFDVGLSFRIERPGTYRLRAATVDIQGRTAVLEKEIVVGE
jgi:hypothetical protein